MEVRNQNYAIKEKKGIVIRKLLIHELNARAINS